MAEHARAGPMMHQAAPSSPNQTPPRFPHLLPQCTSDHHSERQALQETFRCNHPPPSARPAHMKRHEGFRTDCPHGANEPWSGRKSQGVGVRGASSRLLGHFTGCQVPLSSKASSRRIPEDPSSPFFAGTLRDDDDDESPPPIPLRRFEDACSSPRWAAEGGACG